MAYKTGTATDYLDLLTILKDFITTANEISEASDLSSAGNEGGGSVDSISAENDAPTETWILTCIDAGSAGLFSVEGSVSGVKEDAIIDVPYDNGIIAFTINEDSVPFEVDDGFTFDITQKMGGEVWETKRWDIDVDGSGEYELIVKGPGMAGADEIYVGIQTYSESTPGNYFNWKLQGFTGYNGVNVFDDQPGAISSHQPRMLLWDSSIDYWIVANGRRFIVVAKVSMVFEACYLGFLLPYGIPSSYPYPLVVGGSSTDDIERWSETNNGHRLFVDPGGVGSSYSTLALLFGTWRYFINYTSDDNDIEGKNVWPYNCGSAAVYPQKLYERWRELRLNLDDSVPVFPLILNSSAVKISRNVYGELQGCFAVPGEGVAAEDIITISSIEYIVMANVWRGETHNLWALKLE